LVVEIFYIRCSVSTVASRQGNVGKANHLNFNMWENFFLWKFSTKITKFWGENHSFWGI